MEEISWKGYLDRECGDGDGWKRNRSLLVHMEETLTNMKFFVMVWCRYGKSEWDNFARIAKKKLMIGEHTGNDK